MVSNICYFHPYFHPYLGKIPILTNIFQMGWFNHQPDEMVSRQYHPKETYALSEALVLDGLKTSHPLDHTWRIIPVSKWLVTIIYKPFRPFGRGITRSLGDLLTMVINHLLNGMILQVGLDRDRSGKSRRTSRSIPRVRTIPCSSHQPPKRKGRSEKTHLFSRIMS